MKERILSTFIDESGDFGSYEPHAPYYYVSLVLHDQSIDISENITVLEEHLQNLGYSNHSLHSMGFRMEIRRLISLSSN